MRTLLASVRVSRFRAILSLIYHCGLRVGEACRIEVTHLDAERGVLRILNAKGGSRSPGAGLRQTAQWAALERSGSVPEPWGGSGINHREVPISPEMLDRLRLWWKQHRHPIYLFPGIGRGWKEKWGDQAKALRHAAKPMSDSSVQVAMTKAVLTSGLKKKGVCCHALRH